MDDDLLEAIDKLRKEIDMDMAELAKQISMLENAVVTLLDLEDDPKAASLAEAIAS